jgi:hypothetical protein
VAGKTAYFQPGSPPPAPPGADAAGRTVVYSPGAPPAPPADAAGKTSLFVPTPPPAPTEAAGRTSYFQPAPPPERTVVFGSVPPPAAPAAAVPKAFLVAVEATGAAGAEHALRAENKLGRVPENEIPVPHGSVSRHHATIRYRDAAWWIEDQKSENGTWVNGERVAERQLGHDDRINIGTVRFRFKLG